MQQYETVIGLEVHAQLLTRSKMFCGCSTRFGAPPNTQTCPVCLGLPGVLPVLNREAVRFGVMAALATHCEITPFSQFSRKNYFYPDLPKGYQISQYDLPLAVKGFIETTGNGATRRIRLTRIHMEEDAGKSLHEGIDGASHVDLNRAGVPLLEIVSEPDLRTPEEAADYLRRLRDILRYLKVCDGNMEQGSFRCDANVSIRPVGETRLGTKVEVKNMNSFRFVQKALEYEIERQMGAMESGEKIVQETRLWDAARGMTFSMRSKEEAHDYRYFPEPDLVPLEIPVSWVEETRKELPELPEQKKSRYEKEHQLPSYNAAVLTSSPELAEYYEQAAAAAARHSVSFKEISNVILGPLMGELNRDGKGIDESPLSPEQLVDLQRLVQDGTLSSTSANTVVLPEMVRTGKNAKEIVQEKGLVQVTDTAEIERMIRQVMENHPKELAAYRSGKDKLFGFFVGQVMKVSAGKASPALVNDLLKKMLSPDQQGKREQ
jgi:aspartyl-tRNA(Asn)/glutamyl-tRNA(Gln) amidotransferase subunit B